MCAADRSLEPLRRLDGEILPSVDGWGTVQQCSDWGAIFEWAEMHRATDEGGIA